MVQAAPSQSYPSNKDNTPYLTTNQGTRVYNNDHSLTVGTRGEVLALPVAYINCCESG